VTDIIVRGQDRTRYRIAGLASAARRDTDAHAAMMRRALRDRFLEGHDCRLCPRIDIPEGISDRDRQKRAERLWKLHWERMRLNRKAQPAT